MIPGSVRAQRGRMMVVIGASALGAVAVPIVRAPQRHFAGDVAVEIAGWHDLVARCRQADLLTNGSDDMRMRLAPEDLARCQQAARHVVETRQHEAKYARPADSRVAAYVGSAARRWHGHQVGTHLAA